MSTSPLLDALLPRAGYTTIMKELQNEINEARGDAIVKWLETVLRNALLRTDYRVFWEV